MISLDKAKKDVVFTDLSGGSSDSVNLFSGSSCSSQESQGSLLDIKLDCPQCEEVVEVLIEEENDVPETVEEDESKCFGFSCLDRLKYS